MSALTFRTAPSTATPSTPQGPAVRRWLALDAVVTGGNALAYLLARQDRSNRCSACPPLLVASVGAFLLVFAGGVGWLAAGRSRRAVPVRLVIEANAALGGGRVRAALAAGLGRGTAAVRCPAQAAVVAAFAGDPVHRRGAAPAAR